MAYLHPIGHENISSTNFIFLASEEIVAAEKYQLNFRKGRSKKKIDPELPVQVDQKRPFLPFDPKSKRKEKAPEENPATAKVSY